MKILSNYCVKIELEDELEVKGLASLIYFGIKFAETKQGYYVPDTTIEFGKELLDTLRFGKGTNNENN